MLRLLSSGCALTVCVVVLGSASAHPGGAQGSSPAAATGDSGVIAPAESFPSDSLIPAGPARAVEYSEGYGRRLAIHRVASYAELPLFATEFILGEKILSDERNGTRAPGGLRSAHTIAAVGLGVLFAVNTVTGVWNLVEARHDPVGRTRRTIHSIGMLLADAGFVWTASLAGDARRSDAAANKHRPAPEHCAPMERGRLAVPVPQAPLKIQPRRYISVGPGDPQHGSLQRRPVRR